MRATRVRCVPRRLRTFACALLGLVTVLSGAPAATRVAWNAGQADSVTILESSATIARDISGGQRHVYQITISEDQYASVAIDHQGVELVERLAGADAVATIEAKSAGGDGEDLLQFTVDTPTTYRIQVEPKYPKAPAGKYEIRVAALRPATDTDRVLHDARRQAFQAFELYRAGAFDRARVAVERALEIRERVLGPNHAEVAAALNALGLIVAAKGDNKTAEMLYRRALAVDEATHETAATVDVLENLSRACARSGDFAEAERVARRGLAIAEQAFAPDHFRVAESLVALADVYLFKNDTTTSREWSERAFEIAARWYGADEVPPSFSTRAAVVQLNLGNYSRAEQLFAQGVSVAERTVGKDTPTAAEAILGLAYFYVTRGDNLKAEEHYLHGLAILENTVGRHHLQVAAVLDNLGLIAYRRRDWATAEATLGRSIAIKEQTVGADSALLAAPLNTLGLVYWKKGDYPNATEVFQRTLQICEKSFGPDSLNAAHALGNLGIMAKETGDYPRAVGYYARDLAVVEKLFGKQHRQVVQPLEDFGILYRDAGDYVRAEPMFLRALAITEQSVGPEHADIARHLLNLASLYAASGDRAKALESLTRMSAVEERNLPLNLAVGSERQKLAYFGPLAGRLEELISFQVREQGSERQARDLAATMLLQRKGRVLDAMADSLGALRTRANPEDAGLVDDLRRVTAELAAVALNAPRVSLNEQQRHVNTLITQREQLEQELNRRTAGYYEASGIVTLAAVRATIPADAALIEFAVYRPFYPERAIEDRNRRGDPRYVAYVIRHEGDVQWTELGSAKDLDEAVAKFRRALADPKRGDVRELARLLDEQTMRPLRSVIGDATRLLVAPDGQLDLIPFEALVDEEGRFLVERYAINYLTTGRDLLRMTAARSSKSPPLVVAYPSFGETKSEESSGVSLRQAKGAPPRRARRSITTAPTLANVYFAPLTGTRQEALAIQSLFPETTILSASQATKSALKQVEGPRMLHIATHGFFLQDGAINNPLLRSGLALAGANTDTGSADRGGILTALEASTLNLWGTKLVTLSACDTGVGEVRNGEGVFGLRRAFFLAGAETLVMSLWPVSDYVTREMMTTYYSGLKTGLGRGEALRQAQLAMMKRKGREHPFFWASFIQAGEWANLDGRR